MSTRIVIIDEVDDEEKKKRESVFSPFSLLLQFSQSRPALRGGIRMRRAIRGRQKREFDETGRVRPNNNNNTTTLQPGLQMGSLTDN